MATRKKVVSGIVPNNVLTVEQTPDETGAQAMARKILEPHFRHALIAAAYAGHALGSNVEAPGIMDFIDYELKVTAKAQAGDLAIASQLLASQAITLDAMFTELARRAANNMGDYPLAADRYARLALKAQGNSRVTVEALAKLHQPREQTVRHVHVNEGGQAVIANQFHHHAGGIQNGKSVEQSHTTRLSSDGDALPCPNASGNGLPIPGRKGQAKVPNARRNECRRSQGQ